MEHAGAQGPDVIDATARATGTAPPTGRAGPFRSMDTAVATPIVGESLMSMLTTACTALPPSTNAYGAALYVRALLVRIAHDFEPGVSHEAVVALAALDRLDLVGPTACTSSGLLLLLADAVRSA